MAGGGSTAKAIATGGGSLLGPLAGLAGNVIGGLFGKSGQSSANAANYKIAKENRAWQERMSNTAYQRSAQDLEKAGLNRILAIGSPSSTPAGNIATMQNENAPLAEGIKGGIQSAMAMKTMQANIRNINARTELTDAQRRALGPAATVGGGLEEIIVKSKDRLSGLDWGSMGDQIKRDVTTAKDYVTKTAESVGLTGHKAERLLLATLNKMDLPKGMTDEQKLAWAKQNPEKIKRYLERKNR